MPGLINTHTHAPMVLYRGLGDDLALMDWLQKYIFPAEAKTVSPAFVRTGTRLAALEMIRSGTTTYTDMYYFEEEIARATREAGLRGVLGQTVIEFPVPDAKTPADALARAEKFIVEFQKDPLIVPAVAPHAVYTLDAPTLKRGTRSRREVCGPATDSPERNGSRNRPLDGAAQGAAGRGARRARVLGAADRRGARRVAAARRDSVLKNHGVGVSHNPESNMKLASGTAPVQEMIRGRRGGRPRHRRSGQQQRPDMFEAMRQTAFLHKLTSKDPRAVGAAVALEMATLGGARVIGREKQLGSLEAGKLADVIVVRMDRPRQTPMYDPISHLVYVTRGDDVETTIVNGKVLMRDGKVLTLNEADVSNAARQAAGQVRAAVQRVAARLTAGRRCRAGCGTAPHSRGRSRPRTGPRS